MSIAVKVKNVSKSFNDSVILDDISIDFYENKIYGLLGKNGVGKTTLLNIITKQLISKSGTIEIFGQNINESDDVLDKLCIVREREFPENDILIKELFNTYSYFYKDYDKNLQEKLCAYFELDSKKSYRKLSRGMKSIVSNIIGICSNASITIFDEPTIGLDAFKCLVRLAGGSNLYIANESSLVKSYRNKMIRKEFNGDYKTIARKFGISEVQVRNIIKMRS